MFLPNHVTQIRVSESPIQRTSQRVNWTYVARDIIDYLSLSNSHFDRLVARSIVRSLTRSLDRSIARLLGRSLDRSVARSIARALDMHVL